MALVEIGSTVYIFDINRRVYPEGGGVGRGPIWREHWRPEKITGETARSWITDYGTKVPKKGADPRSVAFSAEEIDKAAWVQENRYAIIRELERLRDYDTWQTIAALLGYPCHR